jgi:hypothetical protein
MSALSVRSVGVVAAFVLAAAACSSSGGTTADVPETPAVESPTSQPSEAPSPAGNGGGGNGNGGGGGNGGPVPEVLRFSAPRLSGGTVEGEDFAGRDVAIWFWAPW